MTTQSQSSASATVFDRGREAHRQTVETGIDDAVRFLQEVFGQKLVAYMAGVADTKTVGRWTSGEQHPRSGAETRLRAAFQVFQLLQSVDSPHTVRAWFVGMNPQLDDLSPARAIRDGQTQEVMVAARAYMAGG